MSERNIRQFVYWRMYIIKVRQAITRYIIIYYITIADGHTDVVLILLLLSQYIRIAIQIVHSCIDTKIYNML